MWTFKKIVTHQKNKKHCYRQYITHSNKDPSLILYNLLFALKEKFNNVVYRFYKKKKKCFFFLNTFMHQDY